MFDTHNAEDETESHTELVKRYFRHIAHVHVNEMDEPGTGNRATMISDRCLGR